MPTIQEIAELEQVKWDMLAESEGEVTPEVEAVMEELQLTTREKIDAYFHRRAMHRADAAAKRAAAKEYRAIAEGLGAAATADENKAKRLDRLMLWFLKFKGVQALHGNAKRVQVQLAGGALTPILKVAPSELPARFLIAQEPKIDFDAIRRELTAERPDPAVLAIAALPQREDTIAWY